MKQTDDSVWREAWRNVLAGCSGKVFFFDLDGTVWDDILVVLNEVFGPVDDTTGEKKWKQYDRAFKVLNTMTNGAHLEAEYRDLLTKKTIGELIAWLKANHRLVPGIKDFLKLLADNDITAVAISNGAYEIADEMLHHHDIVMPRVCNSLVMEDGRFTRLAFFHDEHEGIRKGDLVDMAVELGYEVVGCAGDSKGDVGLYTQTVKAGGIVIAVNNHGLSTYLAENADKFDVNNWLSVSDYADAIGAIRSRVAGN